MTGRCLRTVAMVLLLGVGLAAPASSITTAYGQVGASPAAGVMHLRVTD